MGDDHRQEARMLAILRQKYPTNVQSTAGNDHRSHGHASELVRFLSDFTMHATRNGSTDAFQCHLGYERRRLRDECTNDSSRSNNIQSGSHPTVDIQIVRRDPLVSLLELFHSFSSRCHLYYNWPVSLDECKRVIVRVMPSLSLSQSREP